MCGIIGYVGPRPVLGVLLQGLKRLEYRGYDSAGVAFFKDSKIEIRKSEGKLSNVEKLIAQEGSQIAHCGMGHTRWATHGKPTTQNAHPHRTGHVVLVHNGIIENYQEIHREIQALGFRPESETDSELFGFLVLDEMNRGSGLAEAVRKCFLKLKGAFSFVVMSDQEPGTVVGVRHGCPLVAGLDPQGGSMVASDAQAIIEITRDVIFLENGDLVVATEKGLQIIDVMSGKKIERKSTLIDWSTEKMDKQGYAHYMLKEIHEQPLALMDTMNAILDRKQVDPFPLAMQPGVEILKKAEHIFLVACGTSWHAALLGKYWLEKWAGIPVSVELASEFRYREPVMPRGTVVIGVSQSGETADTLAVISDVKKKGIPTIAVSNVRGSTLSREADASFYTAAGPEIGVAATKTFSTQMIMMLLWAGCMGVERTQKSRTSAKEIEALFDQMIKMPHVLSSALQKESELIQSCKRAAQRFSGAKGFFFMGRGYSFPIALEGALKLKEIAYVHAEGYAAGELKHGPIAMIDKDMVVVVLAPEDQWKEKTASNLQEVKARNAKIIGVGNPGDEKLRSLCDEWISIPTEGFGAKEIETGIYPFLMTPVVQLLSYELALLKGTEVDQPRNLAKSVTVE